MHVWAGQDVTQPGVGDAVIAALTVLVTLLFNWLRKKLPK